MTSQIGFLLSFIKYGDSDCILHFFTQENGFQSFFLKGVYSSKNKKKALLFPLNELSLTANSRNKSMSLVSKIELEKLACSNENVKIYSVLLFVADFLNQVLKNEPYNSNLYGEIHQFLEEINQENYISHLIFLLNFLKIIGISPLLSEKTYLNPETGEFESEQIHQQFTSDISEFWKRILSVPNSYQIEIPQKLRNDFLESIILFYHFHFHGFQTPKSLEVVRQIYQ